MRLTASVILSVGVGVSMSMSLSTLCLYEHECECGGRVREVRMWELRVRKRCVSSCDSVFVCLYVCVCV